MEIKLLGFISPFIFKPDGWLNGKSLDKNKDVFPL
jgi:hypothetical protein